MRNFIVFVLSGILLLASCKQGGQSIELKFNPKSNQSYKYELDTKMEVNATMFSTKMNMLMGMSMNQEGMSGPNHKMSATIDKIKMDMNMPMVGDMKYDSEKPDTANPAAASFAELIGKKMNMEMSQTGEITNGKDLEGMDQVNMGNLGTQFGFYPDKPVKVGDTWEKESTQNVQNMSMLLKAKYTLKSVNGDKALVDCDGTFSIDHSKSTGDPAADKRLKDMKMEGTQKGTMELEVSTGMLVKTDLLQDIKMTMDFGGSSVPMTMKNKLSMKRTN